MDEFNLNSMMIDKSLHTKNDSEYIHGQPLRLILQRIFYNRYIFYITDYS